MCIKPCGDGEIDAGESCDTADLNGMTCTTLPEGGFIGGNLACNRSCGFDTSGCKQCTDDDLSHCPDNKKSCKDGICVIPGAECYKDEECAGNTENGKTQCNKDEGVCIVPQKECTTDDNCSGRDDGKKKCNTKEGVCVIPDAECRNNTECSANTANGKTKCSNAGVCIEPCGDGVLDDGESCDMKDLGGMTCASLPEGKYIGGTLLCNSLCEFDKARCEECTENDFSKCPDDKKACSNGICVAPESKCGNGQIEEGENCDRTVFKPGKTDACADWGDYNQGKVFCNECKVNTSQCSKVTQTDCNTEKGQAWSSKYGTCVYYINTKNALKDIAAAYDSGSYATQYPGNGSNPPVFVLNADLDLTTSWTTDIGEPDHGFEGTFYGENHTIKIGDVRLFHTISDATVQDLAIVSQPSTGVSPIFANTIEGSKVKNITLTGTQYFKAPDKDKAGTGAFANTAKHSTVENIDITLTSTINLYYYSSEVYTPFILETSYSTFQGIRVHGSTTTKPGYYAGLAGVSDNDTWSDCIIDASILIRETSNGESCALFKTIKQNTSIDRVLITENHFTDGEDTVLIWDSTACQDCRISNLQDFTQYQPGPLQNSDHTLLTPIYNPGEHIQLVNVSIYNTTPFRSFYLITKVRQNRLANVIFGTHPIGDTTLPSEEICSYVYFEGDEVTAEEMNKHLTDKTNIPKGTYLPWKQDGDRVVLDFNAGVDDMIEVK